MITTLEEKPHIPAAPRKRKVPGWAVAMLGVAGAIALLSITSMQTHFPQLTSSGTTQTAVRLALPILLAGLGGLWAERAGVVNIGLEGMMIMGTWGAAWAGYQWGPWAALVAAVVFGSLGGLLHAIATVTFGVNHIVSGVAINLLGAGLTKYLSTLIFLPLSSNPRQSPPVQSFDTFSAAGLGDWLGELEAGQLLFISDVAGILRGLVTGVSPLTMIAILLLPLSYFLLWRTRFGLRLRSVGENPHAADSLGVKVYFHKYVAVIVSGGLAGLGGAALVLNPGQLSYLEGQTGGRGYIGLAAMIFGNWRPGGLLGGAALFGYADGLQLRSGGETVLALVYGVVLLLGVIVVWQLIRRKWFSAAAAIVVAVLMYLLYISLDEIPSEFVSYAPHMVTLAVLAVASQRLRMPAADGLVYRRG
ncbi:ABC transporter permease [Lentzea sp. BCCO 10_0798]|uniref:ABC transporter permease n=1 Tax=Lentzea kristufekii TaxID=3095430 RepID=A0ABU4TVS1_9PSEU|nr:ABC transporter permease [Lentzea sp. BCCO 10_0798]MDX8051987.1 ABC transporter permease [Lentzea sp. BCCO 10_0798]